MAVSGYPNSSLMKKHRRRFSQFILLAAALALILAACMVSALSPDGNGITGQVNDNRIPQLAPPPGAAFICSPTNGPASLPVTCTDQSTGTLTGRAWYFGDETYAGPWTTMTSGAAWSGYGQWPGVVMPDGTIVIIPMSTNDVWQSTDKGASWTKITANSGLSGRSGFSIVAMADGSIILMGGSTGINQLFTDVLRSADNGRTWTIQTPNAGWHGRVSPCSVVMPDGSIVMMGGFYNGGGSTATILNDVWRSTNSGITWTLANANAPFAGYGKTSVATPSGSIIVMGGTTSIRQPYDLYFVNSTWRSTDYGKTWTTQTTSAGWSPRIWSGGVAMPDNSIVLAGGQVTGSEFINDLWRSVDEGRTWTRMTPGAGVPNQGLLGSVVLPDGSIILYGADSASSPPTHFVWRLATAGSSQQNPSHSYVTQGRFNVSLQAFNTGGWKNVQKPGYITVTPPASASITVTSPNGRETWIRGTTQPVTWKYTGNPGSLVKITLLKSGVEVGTINSAVALGTSGTGSYPWPMSMLGMNGNDFRVKIQSISQPTVSDASDADFIISYPSITVVSPNGGEILQRGTTSTISWASAGSVGSNVMIELLKAGVLVQTISSSTANDGSFPGWTVPTSLATGTDYKVRITSTANSAWSDVSNSNFAVSAGLPTITVTSPNGGETWIRGTTHPVTWKYTGNPGSLVKITLLKSGVEVGTINSAVALGTQGTGSYLWPLSRTGMSGNDFRVKIQSLSQPAISDVSDANVIINYPR